MTPARKALYDQVLHKVNEARIALDHPPLTELPKGRRNSPCDCVIARAIPYNPSAGATSLNFSKDQPDIAEKVGKAWGFKSFINPGDDRPRIPFPPGLASFIDYFDRGLYPELIERR